MDVRGCSMTELHNYRNLPTTNSGADDNTQLSDLHHSTISSAHRALTERTKKSIVRPAENCWSRVRVTGNPPAPSACHSLVCFRDRYLVLFGGGSTLGISNAVFVYDLDTNVWHEVTTENAELVAPRLGHSAALYNTTMIVYGGQNTDEQVIFDDVLALDLETWRWTLLQHAPGEPDGPGPRRLHTSHVVQDRFYVFMGEPCSASTMFWYMDLNDYSWHNLQQPLLSGVVGTQDHFGRPVLPLFGHSSVVEGDYLYLFGGLRHNRAQTAGREVSGAGPSSSLGYGVVNATFSGTYANALYRYHFPSNTWTEVLLAGVFPTPAPRYAAAMGIYDGRLYLFGGDANRFTASTYFGDFWLLDTRAASPRWRELTAGRLGHVAAASYSVSDHGRSGAGVAVSGGRPGPRSGCSCVVARCALYIMGGEEPGGSDDFILYSGELYRYPLGLSMQLSLHENACRWMTQYHAQAVRTAIPTLPRRTQQMLRSYLPVTPTTTPQTSGPRGVDMGGDSSSVT